MQIESLVLFGFVEDDQLSLIYKHGICGCKYIEKVFPYKES